MKPKLIFWIDSNFYYFGLAKSLQEMLDCELYSIIEITDKPKKFFKKQQIVNFKKICCFLKNFFGLSVISIIEYNSQSSISCKDFAKPK
jgi:hypothetical protein